MSELDEACARVLDHVSPGGSYWHEDQEAHLDTPAPYSSADYYTHLLEDEIERRGRAKAYIDVLVRDIAPILGRAVWEVWGEENYTALWALIRATPEQRARAFLEAVKE